MSANGKKVGDAELEAQPTDSRIRSLYRTWDVTSFLQAGDNAVGFLIGEDSDVILQIQIEWSIGPADNRVHRQYVDIAARPRHPRPQIPW